MSESEFISSLENLGLSISDEQINKFRVYASELLSYNEHTNLTAILNIYYFIFLIFAIGYLRILS